MKLHFLTYYQKLSEHEVDIINKIIPTFFMHEPLKLMNLMFGSVKLSHPDSKMTLLTNQSTAIESLDEEVEVIRYPYDRLGNRLAEQLSIHQFLKEYQGCSALIFLDYDMLVQESLESVFDKEFDLFLVRRPTKMSTKPPINMGVVGVQQNRYKQAARFFSTIISQIIPFKELHEWGGSQLAVQKMLFEYFYRRRPQEYINYKGLLIRLVSDAYNYTPKQKDCGLFFPNKKLIHFKGGKKAYMSDYWENYLKPK